MEPERESDSNWLMAFKKLWRMLGRLEAIGAVVFIGTLLFFAVRNWLLGLI